MIAMIARRLLLASLLLAAPPAAAAPDFLATRPGLGEAGLAAVKDDGSIRSADGRDLRLAGIDYPRGNLGAAARASVAAMLSPAPFRLVAAGCQEDRYGRLPVEIVAADGRWAQGELLRHGLVRVATTPDCRQDAAALLAAEGEARRLHRGLWGDPAYALRRADEAQRFIDSVQVVEGRVSSANPVHGGVYLNFGEDWRRSLGVHIPPSVVRAMPVDPLALAGRELRVRGWIGKGIGPLITVSHPEQIEIAAGDGT